MKKIRRIRMTTRTSKLVVVHQNKPASPEAGAEAGGNSHAEFCPTCGQRLAAATVEPRLLQPPPPPRSIVCSSEHGEDET